MKPCLHIARCFRAWFTVTAPNPQLLTFHPLLATEEWRQTPHFHGQAHDRAQHDIESAGWRQTYGTRWAWRGLLRWFVILGPNWLCKYSMWFVNCFLTWIRLSDQSNNLKNYLTTEKSTASSFYSYVENQGFSRYKKKKSNKSFSVFANCLKNSPHIILMTTFSIFIHAIK